MMSSLRAHNIKWLLRQSNLIEGIDDQDYDDQAMIAWEYMLDHNMPLTHQAVKKVQKIMTLRQPLRPNARGYYRGEAGNLVNVAAGFNPMPHYAIVPALMDNLILDWPTLDPVLAHIRFEKVHPFVDGNGRTGRLLMYWQELKSGLPYTEVSLAGRREYYSWFV